jgi:hypothetical protein
MCTYPANVAIGIGSLCFSFVAVRALFLITSRCTPNNRLFHQPLPNPPVSKQPLPERLLHHTKPLGNSLQTSSAKVHPITPSGGCRCPICSVTAPTMPPTPKAPAQPHLLRCSRTHLPHPHPQHLHHRHSQQLHHQHRHRHRHPQREFESSYIGSSSLLAF